MAFSLCGAATAESSTNFSVSWYGRWSLWNYLSGNCARAGARLAGGRGRPGGEDTGSDWIGYFDLESHVAAIDDRPVSDKRSNLVDSVFDLSLRSLAAFHRKLAGPIRNRNLRTANSCEAKRYRFYRRLVSYWCVGLFARVNPPTRRFFFPLKKTASGDLSIAAASWSSQFNSTARTNFMKVSPLLLPARKSSSSMLPGASLWNQSSTSLMISRKVWRRSTSEKRESPTSA